MQVPFLPSLQTLFVTRYNREIDWVRAHKTSGKFIVTKNGNQNTPVI